MAPLLLLASDSPRRRALLREAGIDFETASPAIVERADTALTLLELSAYNAARKGMAVARRHRDRVVLAADTLVALEGEVMGKPDDLEDALRILRRLSGKVHQVCTAVFVGHLASGQGAAFQEMTDVRFKRLSESHIRRYVARVNPLDKAGAYAAQGDGAEIIDRMEGSYSNVVGLPMERTLPILARFGIRVNRA